MEPERSQLEGSTSATSLQRDLSGRTHLDSCSSLPFLVKDDDPDLPSRSLDPELRSDVETGEARRASSSRRRFEPGGRGGPYRSGESDRSSDESRVDSGRVEGLDSMRASGRGGERTTTDEEDSTLSLLTSPHPLDPSKMLSLVDGTSDVISLCLFREASSPSSMGR